MSEALIKPTSFIVDRLARAAPATRRNPGQVPRWRRWELPTWGVALAVYVGFFVLTWNFRHIPLWLAAPLGSLLLAWHGSLQHETIHGHPTRSRRINALLGAPPLALWMPYAVYRESHLRHHRQRGHDLTLPGRDPETHYLPAGTVARMGWFRRAIVTATTTLAGRLALGPALAITSFWTQELRRIAAGDRLRRRLWLRHAAAASAVMIWVVGVCGISPPIYVGLIVYPSLSLTLLRSFVEHRAARDASARTTAVEAHSAWALLFLNNNLHIAHHARPSLPWYDLPGLWRQLRPAVMDDPELVIRDGYGAIFRRYLLRPANTVEHPQLSRWPQ
jgi:fatty acid desaturase